ncbi:MAG: helix-turn-helix transcriptional regulator [Trueperaceae bacterium]
MEAKQYRKIAAGSGLTVSEIASLMGVSRVTTSAWLNGRTTPHPLHRKGIDRRWKTIARAIIESKLPMDLPSRGASEERAEKLREIFPDFD